MFRRRWSGLPEDPEFPTDLEKLGYFINEIDEIRSCADPNLYFNYFIDKNSRINDRLRFAFTIAVDDIIHARLTSLGLDRLALPVSVRGDDSKPQTPIFVTPDLAAKKRIVVVFGETNQDLGVLAHRVIARQGGINEGSMVSIVKALLAKKGSNTNTITANDDEKATRKNAQDATNDTNSNSTNEKDEEVGIILANSGETWWWPDGKRALCYRQSMNAKMESAAHKGIAYNSAVHGIPGNEDIDAHVKCVFESILGNPEFVGSCLGSQEQEGTATVQVIGISEGAIAAEKYLDENWHRWSRNVGCLALIGDGLAIGEVKNESFKQFLAKKARAYITSTEDVGTPIANSTGNTGTLTFTNYGCPVLASGENYYSELTLIKAKGHVIPWMSKVYKAGKTYVNPVMDITFCDESYAPTTEWPEDWVENVKKKRGEAEQKDWEKELQEDKDRDKDQKGHSVQQSAEQEATNLDHSKDTWQVHVAEHKEQEMKHKTVDVDAAAQTIDMQAHCKDAGDEDDGAKAFV
ncbi:hypothetical protein BD289DRAFT_478685 [Coniella lustricola]|uniref:Arb2 domain-containing protein n=1 Tax=Coniella lustricola TaxID=2025994 RepID=A0A2T3ALG9_9PEZI|nr:hypothetical protein BD289DRAFT_478685 [Coniella lustricola]